MHQCTSTSRAFPIHFKNLFLYLFKFWQTLKIDKQVPYRKNTAALRINQVIIRCTRKGKITVTEEKEEKEKKRIRNEVPKPAKLIGVEGGPVYMLFVYYIRRRKQLLLILYSCSSNNTRKGGGGGGGGKEEEEGVSTAAALGLRACEHKKDPLFFLFFKLVVVCFPHNLDQSFLLLFSCLLLVFSLFSFDYQCPLLSYRSLFQELSDSCIVWWISRLCECFYFYFLYVCHRVIRLTRSTNPPIIQTHNKFKNQREKHLFGPPPFYSTNKQLAVSLVFLI